MKVLMAAAGNEPDDFAWTVPGELLTLPQSVCDRPDCGCDRALVGVASLLSTTVGEVADWEPNEVTLAIRGSMYAEEWSSDTYDPRTEMWSVAEWIDEELADVPLGTQVRIKATRLDDETTFELFVDLGE